MNLASLLNLPLVPVACRFCWLFNRDVSIISNRESFDIPLPVLMALISGAWLVVLARPGMQSRVLGMMEAGTRVVFLSQKDASNIPLTPMRSVTDSGCQRKEFKSFSNF